VKFESERPGPHTRLPREKSLGFFGGMMRFEDLYTNILDMSPDMQRVFFYSYAEKRRRDLEETAIVIAKNKKEKCATSKDKKIAVSKEQLALLKALNLI
jgi:hypothetical protein